MAFSQIFTIKKGMYAATVENIEHILSLAHDEDVDFVVHAGDLCNDYAGSPELMRAYHQNGYGLPTYGIYGIGPPHDQDGVQAEIGDREIQL